MGYRAAALAVKALLVDTDGEILGVEHQVASDHSTAIAETGTAEVRGLVNKQYVQLRPITNL